MMMQMIAAAREDLGESEEPPEQPEEHVDEVLPDLRPLVWSLRNQLSSLRQKLSAETKTFRSKH
jgi:hypothetical protein